MYIIYINVTKDVSIISSMKKTDDPMKHDRYSLDGMLQKRVMLQYTSACCSAAAVKMQMILGLVCTGKTMFVKAN